MTIGPPAGDPFRVLFVTQGQWGERIAANVARHAPTDWTVEARRLAARLPQVVEDPDEFLPADLPGADLLLPLGEVPGMAQLVPDLVRRCGAGAVIAPVDFTSALPPGLEVQLRSWLEALGVAVVFPRPFCSLTEDRVSVRPLQQGYDHPGIRRFAERFGRPTFRLGVESGRVVEAEVVRDSSCGCARHVAEHLVGTPVDDAVEESGMLHHHFPCLASMTQEPAYHDTLMHVSGHLVRDAVRAELAEHLTPVPYWRPGGYVESPPEAD
jgi:hypothetical protein